MNKTKIVLIALIFTLFLSACEYKDIISAISSTVYPRHIASVLYCVEDDEFLYKSSINEHIAPASLTKLLTASVALRYLDADTVITVGSEQSLIPDNSSICFVLPGHKLMLSDLLAGMLMVSGNDAAYTVAVTTAREAAGDAEMSDENAVKYFCELMNSFAEYIGMTDSHFTTPDGWDNDEQYTTAADLTVLAKYALTVPVIKKTVGTHQKDVVYVSGEINTWKTTNKLLDPESRYYREDAVGIKTGTTEKAGNCLIAAVISDEKTYITVVSGCSTDSERYELALKLLKKVN